MKKRNLFPKELCEEKYREEFQELDTKSSLDVEAGKEDHDKGGQDDPSQVDVEGISGEELDTKAQLVEGAGELGHDDKGRDNALTMILRCDVTKSPQEDVESFTESHVLVTVQNLLMWRNLFPSLTMTWRLLLPSFLTMLLRKTWRKKMPRVPEPNYKV